MYIYDMYSREHVNVKQLGELEERAQTLQDIATPSVDHPKTPRLHGIKLNFFFSPKSVRNDRFCFVQHVKSE